MQKYRYINQTKFKIICSYDMLRARTFCARQKFLRARYAHVYEGAHNFVMPGLPCQNSMPVKASDGSANIPRNMVIPFCSLSTLCYNSLEIN